MKCIIFDHDGTLMNSLKSVAEATNRTLIKYGFVPRPAYNILQDLSTTTSERVTRLTGITDPEKVEEIVDSFYRIHTIVSEELTKPYPGIPKMLEALNSSGMPMGIVSNCRGDVVRNLIGINDLSHYFPFMLGEEDIIRHKPEPDGLIICAEMMGYPASDCIYIGDGMPDYQAAKAAGMAVGIVTWGHLKSCEIRELSPDYIFETPEEITELFSTELVLV